MSTRHDGAPRGIFTDDDGERTPLPGLPPALACPFCGTHKDIMISQRKDMEDWFYPHCGTCGVDAPGGELIAEAAAEWNTRGRLRASS